MTAKSKITKGSLIIGRTSEAGKGNLELTIEATFNSFRGIVEEVEKHFHRPQVIDDRIRKNFAEKVMPSAPPATKQEEGMIGKTRGLVDLTAKTKRVGGTVKESAEKYLFIHPETGRIFVRSFCIADISASELLADVVEINTHDSTREHKKKNGKLPRRLWKGIDGTMSQQYSTVKRLPKPYDPRIFEGWRCWEKVVKGDR